MTPLKNHSNTKVIGKAKTQKPKLPKQNKNKRQLIDKKQKDRAEALPGEVWVVNNKKTRGHPGLLTKRKSDTVEFIVVTHSPLTARRKNIKLQENFDINDHRDSYIVRRLQRGNVSELGTYRPNLYPRNNIDKSIIRMIKNKKK